MSKNLNPLLFILFFSILVGCNSDKKNAITYFGGKIINPKTNHVVLFSMEEVIDTFFLNKEDKFIGAIKGLHEGLYYFIHGNENQHIYLQPKDSLMLRLNTWSFDESLVFVGKGSERNNMLIDYFLENEKDNRTFHEFNRLNPTLFKQKVDSIIALKSTIYNEYDTKHPKETKGYKEILKIALTYPTYARIEKYPMIYAKHANNGEFPELNDSFYEYRKLVTVNRDSLMYYPPYSQYLRNFLYNETYSLGHQAIKEEYSPEFTLALMKTIDKNIASEETKNAFLKQTVISHFYNKTNCNLDFTAFDAFLKLSTNDKDKEHIEHLINDSKLINADEKLPNFKVVDYTNAQHSIKEITKGKNVLLFFWNPEYVSEAYIVSRINYFSNNYPNVKFIQINIDGNDKKRIQKLDIKDQFYLDENSEAHQFLASKMPRSVLIDKKGKIKNGYASIFSNNLKVHLEELNQKQ